MLPRDFVVTEADDLDDSAVVEYQENPDLAHQLKLFMEGIYNASNPHARKYTGISHYLLLSLMKRIRFYVWIGRTRHDILSEYAP